MMDSILVVADDADTAQLLLHQLSATHDHVFVATNGMAAVQFTHYCKPVLFIVQDCPPRMHAFQLSAHLHANTELATIPVIILGTSAESLRDEIVTDNLVAFADPFDLSVFLSTVDEIRTHPLEDASLSQRP
jgi:CheY-like chemotaxis protein